MKKVIVIIRESTIRQEIESQKDEMLKYVLSEGYTGSEIEFVGGSGLSALKLDDQYLRALKKVYSLIEENPSIECVFAWAIDRIGRNEEVLMNFKNFLISKKINLRIKNPNLSLLNDDGTINYGMELAFSLFSTMSKQEMEQKKERFKRAKSRKLMVLVIYITLVKTKSQPCYRAGFNFIISELISLKYILRLLHQ